MHCKDISLHDVDFPLTERNISGALTEWKVYVRTEYLVLRKGEELAVVRIRKKESDGLFRKIGGVEIVSMPEDTLFVKDPSIDVLNAPALASVQEKHPRKTVVVEGMCSHINFVSGLNVLKLRVIDNVPPEPARLRVLVDRALSSGFVDLPVIPEYKEIDLKEKIKNVKTEAVVFPCKVSGMKADMPFYFLDTAPDIKHDATLIGCALSDRIFRTLYGRGAPFINICPLDAAPDDGVKTIVRCCTVKERHVIEGNIAKISWGATVPETVDAINALFGSE